MKTKKRNRLHTQYRHHKMKCFIVNLHCPDQSHLTYLLQNHHQICHMHQQHQLQANSSFCTQHSVYQRAQLKVNFIFSLLYDVARCSNQSVSPPCFCRYGSKSGCYGQRDRLTNTVQLWYGHRPCCILCE